MNTVSSLCTRVFQLDYHKRGDKPEMVQLKATITFQCQLLMGAYAFAINILTTIELNCLMLVFLKFTDVVSITPRLQEPTCGMADIY